ncbi:cytochrome P450 [Sporodiniella umbellata]|nr:cytochrome P450 [Sporodiniella umbellata]
MNQAIRKLLPGIKRSNKLSYVGLAIVLVTLRRIYLYLKVPLKLRHIQEVSTFDMAKSFYNREPPYSRFKRLTLPVMKKNNGFYVSKIPFDWTIHIANSTAARVVLMKSESNPKSHEWLHNLGPNSPFYRLLGDDNVGINNGKDWKRQRKVMNPAFHRTMPIIAMASLLPSLFNMIELHDGAIPIQVFMRDYTLDVLGVTIFGFNFNSMSGGSTEWKKVYTMVSEALADPLFNIMGRFSFLLRLIPEKRKQLEAVSKLSGLLNRVAEQRRQEVQKGLYIDKPNGEKDLVTLMLEAEQSSGGFLSSIELQHNIAGLFLAGHETTAHTLSFCFYHLAKNKNVQEKLRQEIISILGDGLDDKVPTVEQLKEMKYLNLVLKENLRHNGPADSLIPRITTENIHIENTLIPKDTIVNIDIYAIHHDPEIWENVEQFIPERFEKGGEHDNHEGLTWLPFSTGSRQCIGMNFSLNEQRLVVATMVRRYEISISKDSVHYDHVVMDNAISKMPDSLELNFKRRF